MPEHNQWLDFAKYDLKSAKGSHSLEFYGTVAYLCQQSAEKALKSYLIFKNREILKTHDLIKLLDLCMLIDRNFSKITDAAGFLNPLSTKFRYPSEFEIPDKDYSSMAIKHASKILRLVNKKISEPDTGQTTIF